MKVCYVDESGNQKTDPCFVMVGILADASRLHRTTSEFAGIFDQVQNLFQENLKELKGSKIIFGRDRWRRIEPSVRKEITGTLCDWVVKRKHSILVSGIDKGKFHNAWNPSIPKECKDIWLATGLHIALQIQKANQRIGNNKGKTFLFFDENKAKADSIAELLWTPPEWTDDYYNYSKSPKKERLDQLVDSAFSIRSHHAGLAQVADLYAFIIRRYLEMKDFGMKEEWDGEWHLINEYTQILKSRILPQNYSTRTTSASSKWYNSIAPNSLLSLGKK